MTQIKNLTPHAIHIVSDNGDVTTINPSGIIARVSSRTVTIGEIITDSVVIPMTATEFGEVENLPEPEEGVIFVVSSLVASRVHRSDVFIPNESVRDSEGRIIGCKSLGRV